MSTLESILASGLDAGTAAAGAEVVGVFTDEFAVEGTLVVLVDERGAGLAPTAASEKQR